MNQQSIQPDEICFNEIIRIHAKQQAPEKAKEILTLALKLQTQLFDVPCFISILDILLYCIGVVLLVEEILHQLRLVVYPIIYIDIIYRVLYIPGGWPDCFHQQYDLMLMLVHDSHLWFHSNLKVSNLWRMSTENAPYLMPNPGS